MVKFKKPIAGPRRVWRITPEAPLGEFVDAAEPVASPAPRSARAIGDRTIDHTIDRDGEPAASSWSRSSYDLLNGVEVSESAPGEFDALFNGPSASLCDDAQAQFPEALGRDQWILRFALRLAELDPLAEPKDVIALAKSIWPMKHFLAPEEAARSEYRWGISTRISW